MADRLVRATAAGGESDWWLSPPATPPAQLGPATAFVPHHRDAGTRHERRLAVAVP